VSEDDLREIGIATPEMSIAKAIERLSSVDRIKIMSVLKSDSDVRRLSLMYDVGETLGFAWLPRTANNILMLNCSLDKGRARRDIVDVVKQPAGGGGMLANMREKLGSFISGK